MVFTILKFFFGKLNTSMRTYREYIESVIDPKNNPKVRAYENDYEDDDNYFPSEDDDDDQSHYHRSKLGKTAQYPLAKASGKMRGFQTVSPKDYFRGQRGNTFRDKLSGKNLIDTLKSKVYSDEPMSQKEIDYLMKILDKAYKEL